MKFESKKKEEVIVLTQLVQNRAEQIARDDLGWSLVLDESKDEIFGARVVGLLERGQLVHDTAERPHVRRIRRHVLDALLHARIDELG